MARNEKKFDDFRFEIENQKITVSVKVVKARQDNYSVYVSDRPKIYFHAVFPGADIDETDTDINKLRETVEKKLKTWYQIEWSLWIQVQTGYHENSESDNISFGYDFFALGKRPDGTECYMEVPEPWGGADNFKGEKWLDKKGFWNGKWRPEYRYGGRGVRDGRPEEGEEKYHEGKMMSLLPATPEIVNSVLAFEMRLKAFGEEMVRRFAPQMVQDTLGKVREAIEMPLALPPMPEKIEGGRRWKG